MSGLTGQWRERLSPEFKKDYYRDLYFYIKKEYSEQIIYPDSDKIYTAFHLTPLEKVKVVVIGQDPYHEPGQAHGLAFSVKKGVAIPPSLVNIYKELHDDIGCDIPAHGDLTSWANQGVLLLNTVLTVRAHKAMSHAGVGWEKLTDAAIGAINSIDRPIVFILWGRPAAKKQEILDNPKHLIIKSPHPSPLSAYRGFFGSKPFSRANKYLEANGIEGINWANL